MQACEFRQQIHAYHDGELSADRVTIVESHLRGCPACEQELSQLRSMSATLRFAARPTMPAEFKATLHQRLDETVEAGVFRLASWLTAAAAMIAIGCVIQLMTSGGAAGGGMATANPQPTAVASGSAWETTAVLAIAEARGGGAGEEYKWMQWVRDDLTGNVVAEKSGGAQGDSHE